jgi:hypothetical protein
MPNFREMAQKAKAAHEARRAEAGKQSAAKQAARSNVVDQAIRQLEGQVLPLLGAAKAEFAEQDIDSEITKDFGVKNFPNQNPRVVFRCLGPRRQFKARSAWFESNGQTIFIGVTADQDQARPSNWTEASPGGDCAGLVTQAVEQALASYFVELQKHQERGTT